MSKPLALDDRGNLRLTEAHVTQQVLDLMRCYGWFPVRTDVIRAESDRGFITSGEVGQADWLFVRPIWGAPGAVQCFWAELKRPKAKTNPMRRIQQAEWKVRQELRGFLCYRAPDGEEDMLAHFKAWFEAHFQEAL